MNPDKIAQARAAGYSDSEINNYMRSSNILSGSSSKPKQPKKKKGGFLTSLLPTVGGALGAVGGSFIAPVAGTAAGGAAGAAFGEFLRQKITGDTEGGLGNVVREGAFGAIPGVGKLAKGGVAAVRAAKAGRVANEARQGASSILGSAALRGTKSESILPHPIVPQPSTTATEILNPSPLTERAISEARPVGPMARTAERLFGRATGIQPGAKVGSQTLSAKRASELKDHIRTNIGSKPTDAADTIFRRNESFIQNKANELDTILTKKNTEFTDSDANKLIKSIKKPVGMSIKDNPVYAETINDLIASAKKGGYRSGELVRRNIDKQIKFNRDSASPDPQREQIMLAVRNAWDKMITKKIPESKDIKRELSKAYDTQTFTQHAASAPGGFGPFGLRVGGREAQSAANLSSRAVEALGGNAANNTIQGSGIPRQLAKAGAAQGATRLGAASILGTPLVGSSQPEQANQNTNVEDVLGQFGAQNAVGDTGAQQAPVTEEEATVQALQILAMQAASNGDTNQANAFTAQAKMLADQLQTQGNGLNVTKVTAQQYGLAESGREALGNLAQMIEKDPNVVTRTATPGRQLPVAGGFISNAAGTGSYDAAGYNIADSILRLRTGAQANESEVKKLQSQIMPRAGDSPDTIKAKMQQIDAIFSNVLDRAQQGGGSSGSDTTDALSALGY